MRPLLDTNVLVSAAVKDAPEHAACSSILSALLDGDEPWCITWVNVYEFLRIVTHHGVLPRPMRFDRAMSLVRVLLDHPSCQVLTETPGHAKALEDVVALAGGAAGNFVHDCHIAALMRENDVRTIVTSDTHFRRFGSWIEVVLPRDAASLG